MTVTIPGDFDLQKIAASGQAFRIAQTPQGWRFLAGDKLLYLQPGSGDTYTASCTPEEWQGFWHRYFDLNRNYAAIRAAVPKQDAYLCAAARAGAGIRILRQDAWEMLVTFIISQRKNIPAIQACVEGHGYGVVRSLCGHGIGKEMHEDPEVPNFGKAGHGPRLREGMCIAVEPMITAGDYRVYIAADDWAFLTRDHSIAAHYENTLAITADGDPLILTMPNGFDGEDV